jgi:CPA2 family monovalent cation:H+ antiporter-2
VLARVGINGEAISERLYSIVLTMAVMTSVLTPFAARLAPVLYARWRGRFPRESMQTFNLPEVGLKNHVIVAGCDR